MNPTIPTSGNDDGLIPPLKPQSALAAPITAGLLTCAGWGGRPTLLPGSRNDAYERPPQTLPRSKGHHRDWLDACKGGPPASANFDYGAVLTEVGLLGLVAMRTRKIIQWDAKAMKVNNAPEAEEFIKGRYRPGWELS